MDPITLAVLLGIASGAAAVGLATNTAMRRMRRELDGLTAARDTAVLAAQRSARGHAEMERLAVQETLRAERSQQALSEAVQVLIDLRNIAYVRNAKGQIKRWNDA